MGSIAPDTLQLNGNHLMSPHPGESPLSLAFALIPMIFGLLVLGYIIAKLVPELLRLRKQGPPAQHPNGFAARPELQALVDTMYTTRRAVRERMEADPRVKADARGAIIAELDTHMARVVRQAHALMDGAEGAPTLPDIEQGVARVLAVSAQAHDAARPAPLTAAEARALLEGDAPKDAPSAPPDAPADPTPDA